MTWNADPRPARRKKPVLLVLGVILASALVLVAAVVLYFENVIITMGPSRHDVSKTAERIIRTDSAGMPGYLVLARAVPYYQPCGHGQLGPLQAAAGVDVRVTGVPAAQHAAFEKAVNDRTIKYLNAHSGDQGWAAIVLWDTPTSTSGRLQVGMGCDYVARWP